MLEKLKEAITNMKENDAINIAKSLCEENEDPEKILNVCTEAMEEVGRKFEAGKYFLPELIMAGEILKKISEMIKPRLVKEVSVKKHGKVLIGTVEGDIHDIGKDIVTFLLDVNGYEVRDIGIDVPPSTFVEEIKTFQPQVVGMSGLLTLSFESMKMTVQAIEEAGLRDSVRIMIGGGQVNEATRTYTGADAYGRDAMEAVNLSKGWIMGKQDS